MTANNIEDATFQQIMNYYLPAGQAEHASEKKIAEARAEAKETYQKTSAKVKEFIGQLEKGNSTISFDMFAFCPTVNMKTKAAWTARILKHSGYSNVSQNIDYNGDGIQVCTIEATKV